MNLRNIRTFDAIYDKDSVIGRKLSGGNIKLVHLTVRQGAELKPHITPFDAEFFAMKGDAVFIIDGKEINAPEGSIVVCPGEIEHGLKNPGSTEITVLVIKHLK